MVSGFLYEYLKPCLRNSCIIIARLIPLLVLIQDGSDQTISHPVPSSIRHTFLVIIECNLFLIFFNTINQSGVVKIVMIGIWPLKIFTQVISTVFLKFIWYGSIFLGLNHFYQNARVEASTCVSFFKQMQFSRIKSTFLELRYGNPNPSLSLQWIHFW